MGQLSSAGHDALACERDPLSVRRSKVNDTRRRRPHRSGTLGSCRHAHIYQHIHQYIHIHIHIHVDKYTHTYTRALSRRSPSSSASSISSPWLTHPSLPSIHDTLLDTSRLELCPSQLMVACKDKTPVDYNTPTRNRHTSTSASASANTSTSTSHNGRATAQQLP